MIWLFAVALTVHLGYWIAIGIGLDRSRREREAADEPAVPISVIVAARDEEDSIEVLLTALRHQTHETFEVVVVDDDSCDETAAIVERIAAEDYRIRLIRVTDPSPPRKKRALTAGIRASMHDRLAFTDADCLPGERWLETIASHSADEPGVVLIGFGPLRKEKGAVNMFSRFETWITATLTAASVGLGRPYMAVGRNFSYPRSLFEKVGGFEDHLHSLSGDDDLLVQQARRHGASVRYMFDPASFVESDAPEDWRTWVRQKLRHTSAGRHYDRTPQLHLALFHASNLAVWLSPLFLGWTGGALLAGRFLVQRQILRRAAEALHVDPDLMVFQPILDLGYVLYNTLLAPAGVLFGGRKW